MTSLKKLKTENPSHKITIVGDFNLNLLETGIYTNNLSDNLTHLGFLQYVSKPTRITGWKETLIDHVYSDIGGKVSTDIIMTGIFDHEITFTTIHSTVKLKKEEITKRWLKYYHYSDIPEKLESQSWESYSKLPLDEMAVNLITRITTVMDELAPIETKKISSKTVNQWIKLWIKVSTQTAYELYKRAKENTIYFFEYKNYKKILRVIRKAKNGYYNS